MSFPNQTHPPRPEERWFAAEPAIRALQRLAQRRHLSHDQIAVYLGIDQTSLSRLLAAAKLRSDRADAIACALGRHPYELWPEWFNLTHATPTPGRGKHRPPRQRRPRHVRRHQQQREAQ
jgi:lambda repressor-like predicted transcriptional regulator